MFFLRSSSEERVLDSPTDVADTIRRVSSHEDFNSQDHLHVLSQLSQDMGHGVVSIININSQSFIFSPPSLLSPSLSKNMHDIYFRNC